MTAMLATYGFSKGTFVGHSYGTCWLSYACKYAPTLVAALLFLDPVCFCLHYSRLTKNFVYHRPDPGTASFMVRTDMIVNWTIQRAFPWAWITLFVEQIHVPCTVFLSDKDALVPAEKVENYFRSKGISISNAESVNQEFFDESGDFNACVFRGQYHGGFTEQPSLIPPIAVACNSLCRKVETKEQR
jgi:pimeloyl-ACP methyl ester carboxylesterase